MPPDSGAFGNFAWMAVNVAVEGLFYVTERPSLLGLRRLLEGGIDPLLKKALARSFRDAGIDDWEEQVERMDKRNICPPAANAGIELTAAVALWEETVGKKDEGDANAVVGGLIAVFRHNREHYAKITASLQPVLSMLTGGTLAKSFSPDPFDPDDERPIVTVERVVEGGDILYLGLDALPDSTVAGALGSIILADLTAYAGKRYNRGESGTDVKSVSLFVDETANVINGPMIELLNKGLEAGIRVTAAMQTVSDLAARLGSDSRARMALGNFNNLIALRSKDRLTQEFICETFGPPSGQPPPRSPHRPTVLPFRTSAPPSRAASRGGVTKSSHPTSLADCPTPSSSQASRAAGSTRVGFRSFSPTTDRIHSNPFGTK